MNLLEAIDFKAIEAKNTKLGEGAKQAESLKDGEKLSLKFGVLVTKENGKYIIDGDASETKSSTTKQKLDAYVFDPDQPDMFDEVPDQVKSISVTTDGETKTITRD